LAKNVIPSSGTPNEDVQCRFRRSILTEEPKLSGLLWEDISDEAKDFVKSLLVK